MNIDWREMSDLSQLAYHEYYSAQQLAAKLPAEHAIHTLARMEKAQRLHDITSQAALDLCREQVTA